VTCTHCGAAVAAGDAFCEACGGDLVSVPASTAISGTGSVADTSVPTGPSPAGSSPVGSSPVESSPGAHGRTHQIVPGTAAGRSSAPATISAGIWTAVDTSIPCTACGEIVADDGFCTVCGHRARTRREHWTETHGDRVGAVCDKGISHARNEDAMATAIGPAGVVVLVVCDGVTTAPESDRASLAASLAAADVLAAQPATEGSVAARISAWEPRLVAACRVANGEAVGVARALGDPREPPSCTFVAAVVDDDLVVTAWCGDSRAYWLADGAGPDAVGEQLTIDHSLGTEMIRSGMTREQAEAEATSHTITRWLGADSIDATPEFRAMQVDRAGWLLVCSDGLWNYASTPAELSALVEQARADGAATATAIAESLAAFANACGGRDNITVALARCEPPLP